MAEPSEHADTTDGQFSTDEKAAIQKANDKLKEVYQLLESVSDGVDADVDDAFQKIDEAGDLLQGFLGGGEENAEGDAA